MSCTLIHHGHIRLLKKASEFGEVIVALTTDEEVHLKKGYVPVLNFNQRKEILISIRYVSDVIPSKWLIEDSFIIKNKIDILVHGDDNSNKLTACEMVIFSRTSNVSCSEMREKISTI